MQYPRLLSRIQAEPLTTIAGPFVLSLVVCLVILARGSCASDVAAATPAEKLKLLPGFKAELLYSVPKEVEGSWVSMCVDPKGRIIVCDQYGGLFRVTPSGIEGAKTTAISKIDIPLGEAQGLLWAFDSLYVVVNGGGKYVSGLYRVRDTNGDDQLDDVQNLRTLQGGGEHGPHAVLLSPNGESLFVVCGNSTQITELADSRVPRHWGEDHLLPRMPDGNGFMKGVMGPGGCIYEVTPDGSKWTLQSTGFRNQYDAAFNRAGELFSYDADMEWDFNTPWYRPTRVCHAISGAEFGWRNGAGKWPAYYADSVPAAVNIGPGSPTGVTFGYGAKFPAKYQEAHYICDWSYGKLYAVHLQPNGASYNGQFEDFVTGTPLPLTDLVVNPVDGSLYFAIGGRKTQSGLYRITYHGDEPTTPTALVADSGTNARALRHQLEAYHSPQTGVELEKALALAWQHLDSTDRALRWAARIVVEHQPIAAWRDKALKEPNRVKQIYALLALAHTGGTDPFHRNESSPPVDRELGAQIAEALCSKFFCLQTDSGTWLSVLSTEQQIDLCRTASIAFNRFGPPDATLQAKLVPAMTTGLASTSRELRVELVNLLVYLGSADVASKGVDLLLASPTQEEQIDYARALRVLAVGWTPESRAQYFDWLGKAVNYKGGASFTKFIQGIQKDALTIIPDADRSQYEAILSRVTTTTPQTPQVVRPFVKEWTVSELASKYQSGIPEGRNFDTGRALFGATNCFACHRYNGEGGSSGPDLTGVAGRFSTKDLLESMIEPSKVISDQYAAVTILKTDGKVVNGRIANLNGESLMILTDMLNPGLLENVNRSDIEEMQTSPVSMMPAGLINTLSEEEVLDLLAYLLSRGDRGHPYFQGSGSN
jgi:putative heme-binding domain-containing protein